MKCPHCSITITAPLGREACVNRVEVLILICPDCQTFLSPVHNRHSGYMCK